MWLKEGDAEGKPGTLASFDADKRVFLVREGDAETARQWLATPQRGLGDERPMVLAKTDLGAREVEALVDRLEHGVLS